jgi:glycosyltransferase involved in cell wall biosynthesis
MDLYYYKLFNPHIKDIDENIIIDKLLSVYSIESFYEKYPNFIILEFKLLNKKLFNMKDIELMIYYHLNYKNENLLSSIKDFHIKYPDFDIFFYKYIYDLNFNNDIDYLIHYHNIELKESIIYSFNYLKNKYEIDLKFIKSFYIYPENYDSIDIIKNLIINNNFILSEKIFDETYQEFNLKIYKLFNNINFDNQLKYKSYWYHNHINSDIIYSVNSFLKQYNNFNSTLYCITYNIDKIDENIIEYWYKNKDDLIYSYESFIEKIDDFNIINFVKEYNISNKNKNEIITYYIDNIINIKNIYSYKYFLIKYPNFNLKEYLNFNTIINNKKINIEYLYNEYHLLENKNNIYISVNDFYNKNKKFNLKLYKGILKNNKIIFGNDNEYLYYYIKKKKNTISSIEEFYNNYPNFNICLYKYFNKKDLVNLSNIDIYINFDYNIKLNNKLIYSIESFYNTYNFFNKDIYRICNNLEAYLDHELLIHFHNIGLEFELPYNEQTFINKYKNFDGKSNNDRIIIDWYKNNILIHSTNNEYNNIIGHQIVNNISEVLIDLENINKNILEKGISLIIRAKNEEDNIKNCIESVVDLVDEIVFVDNNSTDNTYKLVEEYSKKYNKIKLYKYNINVSKAGVEHSEAIKNSNKNTLGTFYNWCLSKATKYNVFKWDADFICIRNNFIQLVNIYNLNTRDDQFAIWFTGKTIFENNNNYYINDNSFYNEYRIFSYKNDFRWYDGDICEYTEPYLAKCYPQKKYIYIYPLFYEVKRTSIDEFKERSSLIDSRDINDFNILNQLKKNDTLDLIHINNNILFNDNNILIYTPSLNFGGGNQFIINMYNVYKSLGFNIKIIPLNKENIKSNKFENIVNEDIISSPNINFIINYNPKFIFLNSIFPFDLNYIDEITKNNIKIIFITHSDIAYSNYYIEKYNNIFYKILTVNNYTITKLSKLLSMEQKIFYKIINYIEKNGNNNIIKNKNFGVISRFSEDKNIPMLIISLIEIFNKYKDYKCYLVGTNNNNYDNYLKYLCKKYSIDKNIIFTGFKDNIYEYYNLFDFIILPSVSEGCSYNIIEALSLGIPVITSNVGGNHELIQNNINGILYEYNGIRNFEEKNIYITNYNNQLSIIGYFINDDNFKEKFINNCQYNNTEVILPFFVKCKLCNGNYKGCSNCLNINKKKEIFFENIKNIYKSIINMIEFNNDKINDIKHNNIKFFNDNFNRNLYVNQLLEIITPT